MSKIRKATAKDLPAVNRLLRQVLALHHEGRPDLFRASGKKYTDPQLRAIFACPETPVFVFEEDGEVLGYAFCALQQADGNSILPIRTLYVDDVCVDRNARGKKVGTALFDHVRAYAEKQGCHNVTLHVWACNPGARAFYEAMGMAPQYTSMELRLDTPRKQGLPPLTGPSPRVLILGSLPGDESLRRQEYYGHPRNLFWKVLAEVFEDRLPENYPEKKDFLARHRIALWDVFASARRKGSLDARIQDSAYNDIAGLLKAYPDIRTIALNGGKAAGAFKSLQRERPEAFRNVRILPLTSTSPLSISAGWPPERLVGQWKVLRGEV